VAALSPHRIAPRRARALLVLLALAIAARGAAAQSPSPQAGALRTDSIAPRELVVLAHGMGRTPLSMWPIKKALEAEGFEVLNFGYSSYCCSIAEIGESMRREIAAVVGPQHTKVHFVGHSLGNIVIRYVLTRDTLPPRVGRVVMLAPPNQGANAAGFFAPLTGWLLVPVPELSADSTSTVRTLPKVRDVQIGVIAARDDRTVKLPETHLAEETAHLVVGGGHSFIAFLRSGRFSSETGVAIAP
jgi:pimeloyl-ACP methyl ester carboxylesterase